MVCVGSSLNTENGLWDVTAEICAGGGDASEYPAISFHPNPFSAAGKISSVWGECQIA